MVISVLVIGNTPGNLAQLNAPKNSGPIYLPFVSQARLSNGLRAATGSPIAVSTDGSTVWVVNPDANSVSLIDAQRLTKTLEIPVGREPWSVALSGDGLRAYVLNRAEGTLSVIDAKQHVVAQTVVVGPEPIAVVLNPTATKAYVTVSSSGEVMSVDTKSLTVTARIAVGPLPYGLAIDETGQRIYATHLFARARPGAEEARDNGREAYISVIDATSNTRLKEIGFAPDAQGFPNMLTSLVLADGHAYIPTVRDLPDLPNGLTTTAFAAVLSLDRATDQEDALAQLALNDELVFGSPVNNPMALAASPDSRLLYVVLAGSDLIEVVDVSAPHVPKLVRFLPTQSNPRGIAISPDGKRGYVMNYLSRSVSVFDLDALTQIANIAVTNETLDATVLRGKILFNTTRDARMAGGGWVSCASCHLDGGTDSVTWMFPDGPRQTPPLWNATRTLPWHWSAALDEAQDVEDTIERIQHGIGLAPGTDPALLAQPNAGRSADLDALAVFMANGIRVPAPPPPISDTAHGRALFISSGCAVCHGGLNWTTSVLTQAAGNLDADGNGMVDSALRDVGTHNLRDVRGATGFDVPSLLNVGLTRPYLHDGSLPTLAMLLRSGHPSPNKVGQQFTDEEVTQLVAFLNSIGVTTEPVGLKTEQK